MWLACGWHVAGSAHTSGRAARLPVHRCALCRPATDAFSTRLAAAVSTSLRCPSTAFDCMHACALVRRALSDRAHHAWQRAGTRCSCGSQKVPRKWTIPRSSRGSGIQGDGVAELFETLDVAALEPLGIQPIEVVGAQVTIGHMVAQHVVEGHQHRVRHREGGAPLPAAARDPVVECRQVVARRAGDRLGYLA